jgi:UDP-3-O-[3-hydroxymyristoyl] glucosamine N-acyltransferase
MMLGDFVSNKTETGRNIRFEGFNAILGCTKIGDNCLIGFGSVIGYP